MGSNPSWSHRRKIVAPALRLLEVSQCSAGSCARSASLVIAPAAVAARAPTLGEREAITLALPQHFCDAPVECIWIDIRVSSDARHAKVGAQVLNFQRSRCRQYAHDGFGS